MKKKILQTAIALLLVLSTVSCGAQGGTGSSGDQKMPIMTAVTAPMGSGWHAVTVLLSDLWMTDIPGLNVSVLEGGSVGNIKAINGGQDANIGWAYTVDLSDAYAGRGTFEQKYTDVRTIGVMWPVWLNIITLENSKIKSVEDLASAKINVGAVGTGSELAAKRLLEEYGLTYDEIKKNGGNISFGSYSDASTQLSDGIVDVMMGGGAPDIPVVHEVEVQKQVRLIPVSQEKLDSLAAKKYGYSISLPIPSDTYRGQSEDIPAVTYRSVMIVNKDVPEDVVYKMTKAIWDNIDRIRTEQPARGAYMQLDTVFEGIEIDTLHPGAAKFYKEIGIIK